MAKKKLPSLAQFKSGLQKSKEYAGKIAETAAAAIEEIDNEKMSKTSSSSIMIPTTGWKTDSTDKTYKYYYDITATGVTAADLAVVIISPASAEAAEKCVFKEICETMSGAVRINVKNIPTSVISAELRILVGGT